MKFRVSNIFLWLIIFAVVNRAGAQMLVIDGSEPAEPAIDTTATGHDSLFTIRSIEIGGNKKTQSSIIKRELYFHVGDRFTLQQLTGRFSNSRKQVMNTRLFRNVIIAVKAINGYDIDVKIEVEERWYIYPLPVLKAVNYTPQQWWKESRSLNQLNYGVKITHNNLSGRNDKFYLSFLAGYTKQITAQYSNLYLDKHYRWYTNLGFSTGNNKEINYKTEKDKLVAYKTSNVVRRFANGYLEVIYRPAIRTKHIFGAAFSYENIADTIDRLNPHFFPQRKSIYSYPDLYYRMLYTNLDFIRYPTSGFMGETEIRRKGIGFRSPVDMWQLTAKGSRFWPAGEGAYFNLSGVGILKFPFNQPYITKQLLSGTTSLRGYEFYFIDGVAGGYTKATYAHQLLNTYIHVPSRRFSSLSNLPFRVYGKAFVSTGYVYNPSPDNNMLSNRPLYSAGIGLDVITFTDFVIKLELSFNHLGEKGLYLHRDEPY